MKTFILRRIEHTGRSTRGDFFAPDGVTKLCEMLERGPSNPDGHTRVPAGTYDLELHEPSKFDHMLRRALGDSYKGVIRLLDVPGRTAIEIHPANWISDLEGCCAPGESWHVVASGDFCVWKSVAACKVIYPLITDAILHGGARLQIVCEQESPE